MFIPKLNSKYVYKYPFDGGKKLPLAERFERNRTFFVCLATADSISISILPTNCYKVQ